MIWEIAADEANAPPKANPPRLAALDIRGVTLLTTPLLSILNLLRAIVVPNVNAPAAISKAFAFLLFVLILFQFLYSSFP